MNQRPVVIVLGAAVRAGGVASPALARRARRAAQVFHDRGAGLLITTGGVGLHPPSEAAVAAGICIAEGVPASAVLQEDQSTNTRENLAFAARMIPPTARGRLIIVSDFYHIPRALLIARGLGLRASGDWPREGLGTTPLHRHLRMFLREGLALPWEALRQIGRKLRRRGPGR